MAKQIETLSSVHNAMRILKEFTLEQPELGISELSGRLGLAKSTVFRLIKTLTENNLVEQNPRNQKYHLGIAAFELGFTVYHEMELRTVALPLLDKLMRSIRRTVHLGVYDNGGVVYIIKRIPEDHQGTISKIGKRVPPHCTASGKILLAHQCEEEMERVCSLGLEAHTGKTVTKVDVLKEQLMQVKQKGYAVCYEELKPGICSAAVPVFNDDNEVIAAVSLTGTPAQFLPAQVQSYIKDMRTYSRLITERMDFE
ncbi:IclR family transcriptional regulator [Paenibacillus abyssi]|uniref:Glycerol operon regulatory protein n=1 Tax=Paenibacillus abyssi TaxID=1340531 RepID=A0A917FT55_9BACL|nr:IclR family transcriptional regulator [Paenibacillus abyssi]GGG01067.1 IclR family transcriptional regulator [Paenibacillus abyssi]